MPSSPQGPERVNAILLSFVSVVLIGFGVWVVSAGKRYREEYAESKGWWVGSSRVVELTLVKDDKLNLGCSFEHVLVEGLRCGFSDTRGEAASPSPDDPKVLQPYNTVGNHLLLGAGLWLSPDLKGELPANRFTVVCNYHIKGLVKSAKIRFDSHSSFGPLKEPTTVGTLTDCVIPR
jgi:hypothetical protein